MSKKEENSLESTKLLIKCYIDIVKNDFKTNIPRFIRCYLVKKFLEKMNEEITTNLMSMSKEYLLETEPGMVTKKKACIQELDNLNACFKLIQKINERLKC